MACIQTFDNICRKIVCPARHRLNEIDMIHRKFRNKNVYYQFLTIQSQFGYKLSTIVFPKDFVNLPTILYLHANGGNKLQCLQLAHQDVNIISFDFGGCGKSQGEFLTYGQRECKDINTIIEYIKSIYNQPNLKVVLWGRSMGASIALMYASYSSQTIQSIVLDSPFRKLQKVMQNIVLKTKYIPSFILNIAFILVKNRIKELCEVDIFQFDYLEHLNLLVIPLLYCKCQIPIIFVYSESDFVVKKEDVIELYDIYKGPKHIYSFQAHHHEDRPKDMIEFCCYVIKQNRKQIKFNQIQNKQSLHTSIASCKKGISLSTRRILRKN